MKRDELQKLAKTRLADAKGLLRIKRWSAAYYVAGYAVECGLKSCVLVRLGSCPELIFEDRRFSEKCWTHRLDDLQRLAGLEAAFDVDALADTDLSDNWGIVKDWRETTRYVRKTKVKAEQLYRAIADKKHGVFTWIQAHW